MACDKCTVCCTTHGVPELNKPAFVKCQHVTASGCGIYETRPQSCRDFECVWLQTKTREDFKQGGWPNNMRPDRSGGVVTPLNPQNGLAVHLDPTRRNAHEEKPLASRIARWRSNGLRIVILTTA